MEETIYKHRKLIFYIGIILIFGVYLIYLFRATDNIPLMDYWRYINSITEKIFTGKFKLADCYESYIGHKAGINQFLLFLNMKLFHYNTLIEIFGGAVVNLIIVFIFIKDIKNSLKEDIHERKQIIFIWLIVYYMFSLNKWEIITLEFSLAFSLRVLSYILIFRYVNYKIKNDIKFSWEILIFAALFYFVVLFISSAYFAGMIIAFGSPVIAKLFLDKEADKKKTFLLGIILFIIVFISAISYLWGGGAVHIKQKIDIFLIIKGAFIMLAGGIIHESIALQIGSFLTIIVGFILFIAYFFITIKYLKYKCFKKTWIPFILIVYALCSCLIISYGRVQEFDLMYLSSSRYAYETSLGMIGFIWMYLLVKEEKCLDNISKNYIKLVFICLVSLTAVSFIKEQRIAPYRKEYARNCISMMYDIDNYTDEELAVFQGNSAQQVRNGVKLLKRYKLGVFSKNNFLPDYSYSERYNCYVSKDVYEDKWIGEEADFYIDSSKEDKIIFKSYYPFEIKEELKIEIYMDGEYKQDFIITEDIFHIEIDISQNTEASIKLKCDFAEIRDENDKRKLAFILDEIVYQ